MSTPDIITKLNDLIKGGVKNERDALYILVQVRKLMEREGLDKLREYEFLTIYCDWAVHPKLDRAKVKRRLDSKDRLGINNLSNIKSGLGPILLHYDIDDRIVEDDWYLFEYFVWQILADTPLYSDTGEIEYFYFLKERSPHGTIDYIIKLRGEDPSLGTSH